MIGPVLGGLARVRYNSTVNIVCDGNSLTAGDGGYPWPNALKTNPEFSSATITNFAKNGQTTGQMDGSGAADVDGAWVEGKINVLVVWEGTNTICNFSRTGLQGATELRTYIQNRLALHPWIVLIGTCLPRQSNSGQATTSAQNAALDSYNELLRQNYKSYGAAGVFDVRQSGSPFNIPDYLMASFETLASTSGLWKSNEQGQHIHLNGAGYDVLVAQFIIPALRRLPARARLN